MTQEDVRAHLQGVFGAWNARDIPGMLLYFCDDLYFVEHAGQGGGKYVVHRGAQAFGQYLQSYLDVAACKSTLALLTYDGIYARTVIDFDIRHFATNLTFEGNFRQVLRFRDGLISHLEEYHDVDASSSFWRMAGEPPAAPSTPPHDTGE